jgi:hypothetical protein
MGEPAKQLEIGEHACDGVVVLYKDQSSCTSTCEGFHCARDTRALVKGVRVVDAVGRSPRGVERAAGHSRSPRANEVVPPDRSLETPLRVDDGKLDAGPLEERVRDAVDG